MANDPKQSLRDFQMILLADREYQSINHRREAPAIIDSFDDGSFDPKALLWMQHFRATIQNGIFPEPEVLIFVAEAFAKYLEWSTVKSLDQAFGLTSKQRAGNPAKIMRAKQFRNAYCYEMLRFRTVEPQATLLKAAEHARLVLEIDEPDPETMAKYYSEEKWRDHEPTRDDDAATVDDPSDGGI